MGAMVHAHLAWSGNPSRDAVFIAAAIEVAKGTAAGGEQDAWVGFIVPPALILFGVALPKFGRLLGQEDEQEILRHVQSTLAARLDGGSSDRCR